METLMAIITTALLAAGQHPPMPAGMSHEEHLKQLEQDEGLKKRGAAAMGFDQDAATHHFVLSATGGAIEVTVKDGTDDATIAAVREHLRLIAKEFAAGRFDKPFQTHAETPPGVERMQKDRQNIRYEYVELPRGGAVRVRARSSRTVDAIHAFLRYQIAEHKTGDPLKPQ